MLWDDVIDESTPEKLFFSRLFFWFMGHDAHRTPHLNKDRLQFERHSFSFYFGTELKRWYGGRLREMPSTKETGAFDNYQKSSFFKVLGDDASSLYLLDNFIHVLHKISFAGGIHPHSYLKACKNENEYRLLPSYEYFCEFICQYTKEAFSHYIEEKKPSKYSTFSKDGFIQIPFSLKVMKFNFYGRTDNERFWHETITTVPVAIQYIAKYKENEVSNEKHAKQLEKLLDSKEKEALQINKRISSEMLAISGFPYAPTPNEYKRFLSINCPYLDFPKFVNGSDLPNGKTKEFMARIPTAKFLEMRIPSS
jgi:hypothetical protein